MTKVTSTPYRIALVFITLAPLPFAFTRRPVAIIVAYTIVGSFFVPFLAATLLYLNNRVKWSAPVPHNHWTTNVVLVAILALFAVVGFQEVMNAFMTDCGITEGADSGFRHVRIRELGAGTQLDTRKA